MDGAAYRIEAIFGRSARFVLNIEQVTSIGKRVWQKTLNIKPPLGKR